MGKLIILKAWMVPARAHRQNLPARLHSKGYDPLKISFPDYDSPSSALVKMYLPASSASARMT